MSYTIRNILVPVDLSETSLIALDTAVAIARRHKARLHLLNVIERNYTPGSDEGYIHSSHLSNSTEVLQALAGAVQHSNEIKPGLIQEEGNVADLILKTSLLQHADLIVMGSHGASGYRDGFIGSNTYSVMKQAGCPVLSIPSRRKHLSFRRAIFPIRPVTGALKRYDVVCHFLSPPATMEVLGLSYLKMEKDTGILNKIVDEIKDKAEADKLQITSSWANGNMVAEEVLQYTQQYHPDLIILTSVLDVITKSNFIGPYSQKIINCARVPVLSIKKISVPALA